MAKTVNCVKLGREAEGLDFPPLPGELGKRVFENVSKEAWQGWIKFQTMLINENRLSLADPRARKYLADQLLWPRCRYAGRLYSTAKLIPDTHHACRTVILLTTTSIANCHC